ncbi:MAG: amidohydrolase [Erysipelotrichales bacterium]
MESLLLAKSIEEYVLDIRKEIHLHPELAENEFNTQNIICRKLDKMNVSYQKVGSTSTIATIDTKRPGKTLALRADIDALPMKEETEIEYKSSIEDVAHMCGHDVHTAILIGAVRIINENIDKFNGKVKFFFQEGEERLVGAKKIIDAGGMDGVDNCFALHVMHAYKSGDVALAQGYALSGADEISIEWVGVSGHGSSPQLANDSIHAAAVFTTDLQSIVTKNVSPLDVAVIGVGKFQGGSVANIIAKYTELELTMRYFKKEVQARLHDALNKHATNIGDMYGVKANVTIHKKANATYNDPDFCKFASKAYMDANPKGQVHVSPPLMSSEDYSEYLKLAPGAMGWLGIGNEEKECIYFPHHELFKVDEDALKYGVAWFVQLAKNYLT